MKRTKIVATIGLRHLQRGTERNDKGWNECV